MKIRISNEVLNHLPGIRVAVILFKNINNEKKNSAVTALLRGVCAQRRIQLKKDENYREFTSLVNKTKPEGKVMPEVQLMESVTRKITKGKEIAPKDNLYNLIHYTGLKYMSPVFGCDLDDTEKDIEIGFVAPKQGKRPDDLITHPETKHTAFWYIDIGTLSKEEFLETPSEAAAIIQKYCGGTEAEVYVIDIDSPEVDLGYESDKEKQYREIQFENAAKQSINLDNSSQEEVLENPPFLHQEETKVEPNPVLKDKIIAIVTKGVNDFLLESGHSTIQDDIVHVEVPSDPTHGDYSTNIAMKIAKTLDFNPREIAEKIVAKIDNKDLLEKTTIAGPGFINFSLSSQAKENEINRIISYKNNFGRLTMGQGQNVIVEYSSPNIAKPLGVHHLLSTIIGQTLANLYRFAGYKVTTLNWLGDWGTQFGKLIYAYKTWGDEEKVKQDPLNELLNLYVKFHQEEDQNPELVDKGRAEFKKLEEGDQENDKIWEWFKRISIEELQKIYTKLGVSFDEYLGERMYLESSKRLIEEGKQQEIITEGEKGALIVKFENDQYPPYMLQKADGTTLYSSRDLASIKDRIERFSPDKMLYVVDVAQKLHLQQLFETAKKYGFTGSELIHVVFGRMQMPEGKMSTRKGDIILLEEVMNQATERAQQVINQKSHDLSEEEKNDIAEKMAISAIKYNIISQNRETNITFDWDKMLSLEGNSAPYLQYAYARAQSIIRKSGEENTAEKIKLKNEKQTSLFTMGGAKQEDEEKDAVPYGHQKEQDLMRLFPHFEEAITDAVNENKPNILTSYLFELGRTFNSFYNEVSVLNASRPELFDARLKLVKATAQILENGLKVLGISVFERM